MLRHNVRVGFVAVGQCGGLALAIKREFHKPVVFVPHRLGYAVVLPEVVRKELITKITNYIRGYNAGAALRPTVVRGDGTASGLHAVGAMGRPTPRPKRHVRGALLSDCRPVFSEESEQEYDLGRIG